MLNNLLLQNATALTIHSVILVLVSVLVQHWLVEGNALSVYQIHLVIQQLAVQLAYAMRQALHSVTPLVENVFVNLSILESHVISV